MKFVAIILFSTLVSVSGIYILREKVFKLNETAPDNLPFSESERQEFFNLLDSENKKIGIQSFFNKTKRKWK